jgi:hypothetical protein
MTTMLTVRRKKRENANLVYEVILNVCSGYKLSNRKFWVTKLPRASINFGHSVTTSVSLHVLDCVFANCSLNFCSSYRLVSRPTIFFLPCIRQTNAFVRDKTLKICSFF